MSLPTLRQLLIAGLALLVGAPSVAHATSYNQAIYYKIRNKKTGRLLSVFAGQASNGANNIIFDDVGADDQLWSIQDSYQGFKKLINKRSGLALSTNNGSVDNGTNVHIWQYLGYAPDQDWSIESCASGYMKIVNSKRSNAAVSLPLVGNNQTGNSALVYIRDYGAEDDQEWTIIPVQTFQQDVDYRIINKKSGRALSVYQGQTDNGAEVDIYDFVNQPDQYWCLLGPMEGLYWIANKKSNSRMLSLCDGRTDNGSRLSIRDYSNSVDQAWLLLPQRNGYYKLASRKRPQAVLSIVDAGVSQEDRAQVFDDVSAEDQYWSIVPSGNAVFVNALNAQTASLTKTMTGVGMEDVNHEIYGGVYSQMIFGESFQEPEVDPGTGVSRMWGSVVTGTATGSYALTESEPFQGSQSQRITFVGGYGEMGLENRGLNRWGISFNGANQAYPGFLYLRGNGGVFVAAESATGKITNPWGRCVAGSSDANGAQVALLSCTDSRALWTLGAKDTLRNQGRCLDIKDNSSSTALQLWDCNGVPGQVWRQLPNGTFRNPASGLCISAPDNTPGTAMRVDTCGLSSAQDYRFVTQEVYKEEYISVSSSSWGKYSFSLAPATNDNNGRITIKLKSPGTIDVGYMYLAPDAWGLFKNLPVRKDIADAMVAQNVTVLRYGGSAILARDYRLASMMGPRESRQPYLGIWSTYAPYGTPASTCCDANHLYLCDPVRCEAPTYETNGWGVIDFLNFAEAMGVPGIPTINVDEDGDSVAAFIEYVNGDASTTTGGRRRAQDGHPAPYSLHQIELGNEQIISDAPEHDYYLTRFKNLATRIWAIDHSIVLTIADVFYNDVITDPRKLTGTWQSSLEGYRDLLTFAAQQGGRVAIDVHPGTSSPEQVAHEVEVIDSLDYWLHQYAPNLDYKINVFELNAGQHNFERALGNAVAIGLLSQRGNRVTVVSSANALQPDGQNDDGWDQGLVFFDNHHSWLQPPAYVTQMIAKNYRSTVVNTISTNPTLTVTAATNWQDLVLQVVNMSDTPQTPTIALRGYQPSQNKLDVTQLQGNRGDQNEATNIRVWPAPTTTVGCSLNGGTFTYTFPPNSFTILRLY